jgi:drug efflux transport system permease protein
MSLRRLFTVARKEFYHVTRDVRTLVLVTIVPALLLLSLAYVFSFDADDFKLIVMDQDKTDLSRQYIGDLTSDGAFRVVAYVERYEEIDAWMQAGRAQLALVIPPGTAAALQSRHSAPVQAILDGVDVIGARQTLGQLDARTRVFSLTLLPSVRGSVPGVLDVRTRAWYNPTLKSLNSMVPGLMAVVLYMPALALSLSLARERELGSFEGLVATPIRGLEYLFGKTLTYVGFGLASTIPVVLVATLWFHVPFRGNLFAFLALAACYFLASFGLSQVVGSFIKNQQTAMLVMIMVFFVPSFFLAGLILPIDTSSLGARLTAYSLPVTHFILICRGVFLKGMSIADLAGSALALLAISGLTLMLSLLLFRKWVE